MNQSQKNNFIALPLVAIAILVVAGCASAPPYIGNPVKFEDKKVENKSSPELGVISTAEIGDNLYEEYSKVATNTYNVLLNEDATGEMDLGHKISISKGTKGELQKHINNPANKIVCFDFITKPGALDKATLGGPAHGCLVDTDNDGYFDASMFKVRDRYFPLNKKAAYDLIPNTTEYSFDKGSFQRVILYQGITKGTVKISFREFSDNTARPAFTQDIGYDLDDNGETLIAFKGLRIKVLKATNTNITYIVESPFRGAK